LVPKFIGRSKGGKSWLRVGQGGDIGGCRPSFKGKTHKETVVGCKPQQTNTRRDGARALPLVCRRGKVPQTARVPVQCLTPTRRIYQTKTHRKVSMTFGPGVGVPSNRVQLGRRKITLRKQRDKHRVGQPPKGTLGVNMGFGLKPLGRKYNGVQNLPQI